MKRRLFALLIASALTLPLIAQQPSVEKLLSAGRADDAISVLKARIQNSPSDGEAYNLLERAYYGMRRWDDAIAAGEKAVVLAPGNSNYHMWLARAYGEKAGASGALTGLSLIKKVRQEFERAVELDASNIPARTDLAEFYVEAPSLLGGGKDKARRQADYIAQKDPATAHWVRGIIYEKDKKYDLAEQEFKASLQIGDGNEALYWLNLASFYRRRGRLSDMEDAVAKAMVANRKKPNVLVDAASLLFRSGRNFPGAAQAIRNYLASNTVEDAPAYQAHYLLGSILEKQGDKQAAVAEYRAALSLAREYGQAQEALRRLSQ